MTHRASHRKFLAVAGTIAAVATGLMAFHQPAKADLSTSEGIERCATRVSIAFTGKSDPTLAKTQNPQTAIDTLLNRDDFQDRFARFINSKFNRDPGANASEDAAYHMAKYVLVNGLPWHTMFDGQLSVKAADLTKPNDNVTVTQDDNGLGIFRSPAWVDRYRGNELSGLKLVSAFRMQQNIIGLELIASTNAPGADLSATGRQNSACSGCHYDNWYALDKVANVLMRKKVDAKGNEVRQNNMYVYDKPTSGPQQIFGQSVDGSDGDGDKKVVAALLASDMYKYRTCRLAMNFLYGRDEVKCEGPLFDKCVDDFTKYGTIQSALSVIAKDTSFCQ